MQSPEFVLSLALQNPLSTDHLAAILKQPGTRKLS